MVGFAMDEAGAASRDQAAGDAPVRAPLGSRLAVQLPLLVALVAATYANSLPNAFHLDDFYRVRDNPQIKHVWPPARFFVDPSTSATLPHLVQYRPLLPLTLAVDRALYGGEAWGFRVGNLLWMLLATLACYAFVHALLARGEKTRGTSAGHRRGVAWVVAALFALHPVGGIPVNYICARDLLLMMTFVLVALWAYLELDRPGRSRRQRLALWVLALFGAAAAITSKQNAIMLPALIIGIEWTVNGQRVRALRPWLRALPFALVVGGVMLGAWLAFGNDDLKNVTAKGIGSLQYAATQAKLHLFYYVPLALFPWTTHVDPAVPLVRSLDPLALIGGLFIIATLLLALRVRRRAPVLAFCIAAYWLMLAPTSSFLPFHHVAVDYRIFPSLLFLWLALALFLRPRLSQRQRRWAVVGLLGYFGTASVLHNLSWGDERTLWERSVRHGGGALAHHNLAMALGGSQLPRRIELLKKALTLSPHYALAHVNLCRALLTAGRRAEAVEHCERALLHGPRNAQVRYWVGRTYFDRGLLARGAAHLIRAAALDPKNIRYSYDAGRALQLQHKEQLSLPYLERAWALDPTHADVGFLLGWAYQQSGQLERAIDVYQRFLTIAPQHAQARFNLAQALASRGDGKGAVPRQARPR